MSKYKAASSRRIEKVLHSLVTDAKLAESVIPLRQANINIQDLEREQDEHLAKLKALGLDRQ
jgi:hypothetical protein